MNRQLALASLDPDQAIAQLQSTPVSQVHQAEETEVVAVVPANPISLVAEPTVQMPWWRFAVFWILMRLACRVVKFKFEVRR